MLQNAKVTAFTRTRQLLQLREGLTDLLYAHAKDLIQSGRIQIRVASLFLVSFRHLSVLSIGPTYILYQYISSFRGALYHIVFSPIQSGLVFSSFEVKYDIFSHGDEETWTWISTLLRTGFGTKVCSYLNLSQIDCEPSREC